MKRLKQILFSRLFFTGILIIAQMTWVIIIYLKLVETTAYFATIMRILSLIFVVYMLNDRTEQTEYKLIWVMVVLAAPIFGVPFYFIMGNRRPGRGFKRRLDAADIKYHLSYLQNRKAQDGFVQKDVRGSGTSEYLFNEQYFPVHQNTELTYYSSGEALHAGMIEAISAAEHFIFMEYFTIEKGELWNPLLEILLKKAEEGVEVRLLYDDMGCVAYLPRKYAKHLNEVSPHFKCLKYNPVVPLFSPFMNNRDHRKMTIVDGYIGFTGGMNLSDRYININCPYGRWKDAGLRLKGDAVWNMTLMYLEMWDAVDVRTFKNNQKRKKLLNRLEKKLEHNRKTERTEEKLEKLDAKEEKEAFDKLIGELTDYMPHRYHDRFESDAFVQPFGDEPFDEVPLSENVYMELVSQAKKRLFIFTPYLIMSESLTDMICIAAKRGVDVRIVVPGIPDKKLVYRLTRASYPRLKKAGVRLYEYTPGFLHSKCMLCDNDKAVVGTVNLDYRSLFLHFEDAVYFSDARTASSLFLDFQKTFKESHEVTEEDMKKSLAAQLLDSCLQVIAPIL